jgi:hypothetical protein
MQDHATLGFAEFDVQSRIDQHLRRHGSPLVAAVMASGGQVTRSSAYGPVSIVVLSALEAPARGAAAVPALRARRPHGRPRPPLKTADQILDSIARYCERINDSPVEVLGDLLDGEQQSLTRRDLPDTLVAMLHRLTRRPSDQEREAPRPGRVAAHVAVMETEEVGAGA